MLPERVRSALWTSLSSRRRRRCRRRGNPRHLIEWMDGKNLNLTSPQRVDERSEARRGRGGIEKALASSPNRANSSYAKRNSNEKGFY